MREGRYRDWYNCEVSFDVVETEEALKAGHSVDVEREIQLCVEAMGSIEARNVKKVVDLMVA